MLDEFCTFHYPPCHELLRLEEFQLFLSCFLGKNVADAYQVSPCLDKGVQGIDLFLGEPLPRVMLQACLGQIAVQTYAAFLGKCFELRPDFIRTSESMYPGRRFLGYVLFLYVNEFLMKGMNIKLVRKKDKVCEPASSPRNF